MKDYENETEMTDSFRISGDRSMSLLLVIIASFQLF